MAYTLQAIIAPTTLREKIEKKGIFCVNLDADTLCMIPLSLDYVNQHQIPFLPLTGGETSIGQTQHDLCCTLSQMARVAYVEAEFFGGDGIQACLLFEGAREAEPAMISKEAVNHALNWLGVRKRTDRDEFDVVGLGKHRNTEDWLRE